MKGSLNHRRILGTIFLLLAIAMLVAGETLLQHKLGPIATLLYWTTCVCATFAAIICAILDLGRSLRQSHSEQRHMLEQTIRAIEAEHEQRQKKERDTTSESR